MVALVLLLLETLDLVQSSVARRVESTTSRRFAVIDSFDVCGPRLFPGPESGASVVTPMSVDSRYVQQAFGILPADRTETIGFLCTIEGCNNSKIDLPLPFGLFPTISGSGPPWCLDQADCHNGGVAQRANLSAVLERFTQIIPNFVPDPLYNGYVQLDFEDWTPIWEENVGPGPFHGRRYQEYSMQLVNHSHPHLNASETEALAKHQYETAALAWFVGILDHLHGLRPHTRFAWYGVPDTTSYWSRYSDPSQGPVLRARNDRLIPLWASSGWLAPCVYLSDGFSAAQQWDHVYAGVQEAVRCAKKGADYNQALSRKQRIPSYTVIVPPVLAIQWNFYHLSLSGKIGDGWKPVSSTDMPIPFLAAYAGGAAGVISWDCPGAFAPHFVGPCPNGDNSSKAEMVECRVNATRMLIREAMGPMVQTILERIEACATVNCTHHGRCSLVPWAEMAPYYPEGEALCVCDTGYSGGHCEQRAG